MSFEYLVKPKAGIDLDLYAGYLAETANLDVALGFFNAAHGTFALLATQPNIGWRSRAKYPGLESLRVFRVKRFEEMLILYRQLTKRGEILRVVHGPRKLRALLRREGLE